MDAKDTVRKSDNKSIKLNKKINRLNEKISNFHEEISDYSERLTEMEVLKKRIYQFESDIKVKNQTESTLKQKIGNLETKVEKDRNVIGIVKTKLQAKDIKFDEFQEQLTKSGSRILFLKEEIIKHQSNREELSKQVLKLKKEYVVIQDQLSIIEKQKVIAEGKIRRLISTHQNNIFDLNKQIEEKDTVVTDFNEKLKNNQSQILSLKKEIAGRRTALTKFQHLISGLQEEKKITTAKINQLKLTNKTRIFNLRTQIQSKDLGLNNLQEQLDNAQSRMLSLETQIATGQKEMQDQRTYFEKQGVIDKTKYDLLKSTNDTQVFDFKKQIENKNALVTELQGKVKNTQSRIRYIENQIEQGQSGLEKLRSELSNLKENKDIAEIKTGKMESTYKTLISNLKKQIENKEVTIKKLKEKISVSFLNRILFDFSKTNITPEGMKILARVGDVLKNVQGQKIRVIGHTDNIHLSKDFQNKFPSNWELSAARASAVIRYFQTNKGIDPKNMAAMGRAFYDPIASNKTEEGRAQNRRVEIIILPKEK